MADKKIVLKNVEVNWAKLFDAAPKWQSTELEYSIDVKVNDQLAKLMKDYKLNKQTKNKDTAFNGADFITLKLDEKTKNGWVRYGEVFDKEGNPSSDLVGNGSKVNLFVSLGDSPYGNIIKLGHLEDLDRDKKEMFLNFCQVMELVDYDVPSAVIRSNATVAAVNAAPSEEMSIPFEV